MIARKTAQLKGSGLPHGGFVVYDPGGTTGVCHVPLAAWARRGDIDGRDDGGPWTVESLAFEDVGVSIHNIVECATFVVCEDYSLAAGRLGAQQAGSKMPSAQIIGALKYACMWAQTSLYLCPPNIKRAGRAALTPRGKEARALCNSEHKRDVVDIAGYVLRELRR